jgi:fructokinase
MFLACGDSLFDFFLEHDEGPASARYRARAGGSPLNVAIGLARLGNRAGLLTALSDDLLGGRLRRVLEAEGVATDFCIPTTRPTTVSLVGLDADGVPAYQFYANGSADTGLRPEDVPDLGPDVAGIHLGSYAIAVEPVAEAMAFLARREAGRFISLDPNIRPSVIGDMTIWRHRIEALLPHVDLVKISREDLGLIHPGLAPEHYAAGLVERGIGLVVVTDGPGPARGWAATGAAAEAEPPAIAVTDTVGAGDTFMAALLHWLAMPKTGPAAAVRGLDRSALRDMLAFAARAAAITCSRRGADLPRLDELT